MGRCFCVTDARSATCGCHERPSWGALRSKGGRRGMWVSSRVQGSRRFSDGWRLGETQAQFKTSRDRGWNSPSPGAAVAADGRPSTVAPPLPRAQRHGVSAAQPLREKPEPSACHRSVGGWLLLLWVFRYGKPPQQIMALMGLGGGFGRPAARGVPAPGIRSEPPL